MINNRVKNEISPIAIAKNVWSNRRLIRHMTGRDLAARYKGSMLGMAWSLLNPLLLLCVYTFVFSVIFKGRWKIEGHETKADFAVVLFLGLIVETFFTESINRSTGIIVSNVNYVKRVVFPLEILPLTIVGTALINACLSLIIWGVAFLALGYALHWSAMLLPIVFFPLIMMAAGFSWLISSIGVYVRDISQTMLFITMLIAYLAPVFYPVSEIPAMLRPVIMLNPIAFIVIEVREVLIWNRMPDWNGLAIYYCVSGFVAWLGCVVFNKTRKGFHDVL